MFVIAPKVGLRISIKPFSVAPTIKEKGFAVLPESISARLPLLSCPPAELKRAQDTALGAEMWSFRNAVIL
jgi:hypothetical protein